MNEQRKKMDWLNEHIKVNKSDKIDWLMNKWRRQKKKQIDEWRKEGSKEGKKSRGIIDEGSQWISE